MEEGLEFMLVTSWVSALVSRVFNMKLNKLMYFKSADLSSQIRAGSQPVWFSCLLPGPQQGQCRFQDLPFWAVCSTPCTVQRAWISHWALHSCTPGPAKQGGNESGLYQTASAPKLSPDMPGLGHLNYMLEILIHKNIVLTIQLLEDCVSRD